MSHICVYIYTFPAVNLGNNLTMKILFHALLFYHVNFVAFLKIEMIVITSYGTA